MKRSQQRHRARRRLAKARREQRCFEIMQMRGRELVKQQKLVRSLVEARREREQ